MGLLGLGSDNTPAGTNPISNMATKLPPVRLSLAQVTDLAERCLSLHGLAPSLKAAVVKDLTDNERDGCSSHGLHRLPGFVAALLHKKVSPVDEPVVRVDQARVYVDAKGGFAPPCAAVGVPALAEAAKKFGIAAMCVQNQCHFGPLHHEVETLAAEHGCVALSFVNSKAYCAPAGGTGKRLLGSNPIAFAFPREGGIPPFVFDQATAASSRGEIELKRLDGHELPPGCALTVDGKPTVDPTEALAGAQCAMGGVKGSALLIAVELLAACLSDSMLAHEAVADDPSWRGPSKGGQTIIAIRAGDAAAARATELMTVIEADVKAGGGRLPHARRLQARATTHETGVEIRGALHAELLAILDGQAPTTQTYAVKK